MSETQGTDTTKLILFCLDDSGALSKRQMGITFPPDLTRDEFDDCVVKFADYLFGVAGNPAREG